MFTARAEQAESVAAIAWAKSPLPGVKLPIPEAFKVQWIAKLYCALYINMNCILFQYQCLTGLCTPYWQLDC